MASLHVSLVRGAGVGGSRGSAFLAKIKRGLLAATC